MKLSIMLNFVIYIQFFLFCLSISFSEVKYYTALGKFITSMFILINLLLIITFSSKGAHTIVLNPFFTNWYQLFSIIVLLNFCCVNLYI